MVFSWVALPAEMKLAVIENLEHIDVKALSKVNTVSYTACLPALFKNVRLGSFDDVEQFLANVPRAYCRYIQSLELNVTSGCDVFAVAPPSGLASELVNSFLIGSPGLRELVLKVAGSIDHSILSCLGHLTHLQRLTVKNVGDEIECPLSERLVVSIAASIPNLQYLYLDRVSRSVLHAPEVIGVYPYVPLVSGDENIPDHPRLASNLNLPYLLTIPSLRNLVIRDTHLGDPTWASVPVACNLEILDLGGCCHVSEEFNQLCTERIISAAGRTVEEFRLPTTMSPEAATSLKRLRRLHISPFHPVDSVVDTISNLSGSPIESLSMQCFEGDVVDVCSALQEFLTLREERGADFFDKLSKIDVTIAAEDDSCPVDAAVSRERAEAMEHIQNFCRELRLSSPDAKVASTSTLSNETVKSSSGDVCNTF